MAFEKSLRKTGETSRSWIIDSGTLKHMTGDKNLFIKMSPIYSVISTANSRTMSAKGIKTIKIKVRNLEEKTMDVVIYRVLYIPEYSKNLLSKGQLNKWEIKTIIKNGKKLIKKERRLIATATCQEMVYFLNTVEE